MLEDGTSSERLAPVIQYLKKNYAYEITLSELAKLIPMSEDSSAVCSSNI